MSIEIKNVSYVYGQGTPYEKKALDDVTLQIPDGQFIGLIGHTGSGKSTLIQHFNSLFTPTSGQILLNGININEDKKKLKSIRQKVGLVFQYPEHQLFEMTVFKDVAFGPQNLGLKKDEVDKRVRDALKLVGFSEENYEKSPFELSGGQKRRVAIAGVIAMKPEVLILDEPTAGLDPKGRDEILDQVKKLHKEMNITVILVSHSMEDVAKYVDRLIVMDNGKASLDGTPKEIFGHVEELEKMGLAVPQVTYLVQELKKKGFEIEQNVITVEQAVQLIKNLPKGGKR